MIADIIPRFCRFLDNKLDYFLPAIRGWNKKAFTRKSKIRLIDLFRQMICRQNVSQFSEVVKYYNSMNRNSPVNEKSFFLARRKINPDAVRQMSDEFIAEVYDDCDSSILKWNNLIVLGVDGSKYIVPSTDVNKEVFGVNVNKSDVQPAMALVSTLHDCLNGLKLDVRVDRIDGSERKLASRHITQYCDRYTAKAVFVFDRGYVSIRLMDQIQNSGQYFLMRSTSSMYKKYFEQVNVGGCKELEVSFDRIETNEYRDDKSFRTHLLNTVYHFRFAKVVIGKDENGNDSVEYLITNLPEELSTAEKLKELYWERWSIETSYNRLKNRMSTEEFSGYSPELVLQDIYADAWMFNLVSLKIKEADENKSVDQKHGRYIISRNFNKALGTMKENLLKSILSEYPEERKRLSELIDATIDASMNWVKDEPRQFERKTAVNKSKMSYRKSY